MTVHHDNEIVHQWEKAIQTAYDLAKGERLNELHGQHIGRFSKEGLHPFSEQIGRARECEFLAGLHLLEDVPVVPWALVKAAREDAQAEFRREILSEAA